MIIINMSNNPTSEQFDALFTFLEKHRDLALSRLRSAGGRIRSRQLWARLTDELNSLGGCVKSTKQWQKVWADKKYLAKISAAASRRSTTATTRGGRPSTSAQLTAAEKRIIAMIEQTDTNEPAFPVNHDNQKDVGKAKCHRSLSSIMSSPSPPPLTVEQQQVRERATPLPHRSCKGNRSLTRRIFNMEEQRLAAEVQRATEMTQVRQTLQELCGIMRAILEEFRNRD